MKSHFVSMRLGLWVMVTMIGGIGLGPACGDDSSSGSQPVCGNGRVEQGEECDGQDLADESCDALGLAGGTLACKDDCTFDVSACEGQAECGNGTIEYPEECEGADLGGKSCSDLGFSGGDLSCTPGCRFDTSHCEIVTECGDGVRAGSEQCDGDDLGDATCENLGLVGGTLACKDDCTFDVSACEGQAECGNGAIEYPEECDGTELAGQTCQDEGYYGGDLGCSADCTLDLSGCEGQCGDGTINGEEECDGADLGEQTCEGLGYDGGNLGCNADCTFDVSACEGTGPVCGNGEIEGLEECDGNDLGQHSCESDGYYPGTLSCADDCTLDFSSCGGRCGDGVTNGDEECDGSDFGAASCESEGFYGGSLACNSDCTLDISQCEGTCGDGLVNGQEDCDGTELNGQDCGSLGFVGGDLACAPDCQFDTSGCYNVEVDCSDGVDDDGDGLTDCADGDCDGEAGCENVCVADGGQVDCGWNDEADLASEGHDRISGWMGDNCPGDGYEGAEIVYWGINDGEDPADVDVRMWGFFADLDLLLLEDDGSGCTASLSCVATSLNEDTVMEHLVFSAEPGVTYYLVVDGWQGAVSQYDIGVNCIEPVTQAVYEEFSGSSDPFDLDGVSIQFVPDANDPNGYQWTSTGSVTSFSVEPGTGQTSHDILSQGESFAEIDLSQAVSFYGQTYDKMFVSSDGFVTFGVPTDLTGSSAQGLFEGPPRIAGHWTAMDVTQGGTVTVDEMADGSVAISFENVPNRYGPVTGVNTFQIYIQASGEIEIVNLSHTRRGIVGISRGFGSNGPTEVNFYNNGITPDNVPGYYEMFDGGTLPGDDAFDLAHSAIRFVPNAQNSQEYDYSVRAIYMGCSQPLVQSTSLSFQDGDDSVAVDLDAPIQLFGAFYDRIYVGANGYVTFTGPDTSAVPSASAHFSVARISGLFHDFDPTDEGTVEVFDYFTSQNRHLVTVRYEGVVGEDQQTVSFQITMSDDGQVNLCYDSVGVSSGLVGISSGEQGNLPAETNFR